jgi:hypothetical protein
VSPVKSPTLAFGAGERGAGEEAHLEQRLTTAQLVEHQRGEAPQRENQQRNDLGRAEPDSPSVDDRVGERGESHDHEHLAHRVDASSVATKAAADEGERAASAAGGDPLTRRSGAALSQRA